MHWVHLVLALSLLQFFFFCMAVGKARGTYKIAAPATTGHAVFERYFRVQMNTLELMVVFVPALVLFAHYVSAAWAAGIGAVYLLGRILYFRAYVRDPGSRSWGYGLSAAPTLALLLGGLVGVVLALVHPG
ncbi:MAG: MAPEG family protein [Proteobacteria bacterium]|nr:MAPEG family protein [Pseudomonadota bacterium]